MPRIRASHYSDLNEYTQNICGVEEKCHECTQIVYGVYEKCNEYTQIVCGVSKQASQRKIITRSMI